MEGCMSTATVSDVLDRTMHDDQFLDQFIMDPNNALAEYDLTDAEEAALASRTDEDVYDVLGEAQLDWNVAIAVVVIG
jgi:hypothetical protein